MIPHIDPKVDYAFKKIFGSDANAPVLIDLLNAVLAPPPDRRIASVEIINPFNEKEQVDDKLSVVDVKARDQLGRHFNVEMQMCASPAYPERVLYYWAKIYAGQLKDGDNYDKLKATISISFLDDILFPDASEFHHDFQLRSVRQPGLIFSDRQAMHVIELPKFDKSGEELASPFDAWLFFLKNAAELNSDSLPTRMQTPTVVQAMEVLNVISKTDLERERYEAAVRWERDQRSNLQALQTAREEARDALAKGILIGRIHVCQRGLKMPVTPVAELQPLAIDDLESRAKALEQQLGVA